MTISRPLLRKAYSRIRLVRVSRLYVVVSKISSEAHQVTVVPVPSPSSSGRTCSSGAVGDAELEGLPPQVAAVLDLDDQDRRQGVHHGDADAVQAAGHLVAAAAELAAGVQQRQRHRHRGELLPRSGVGRDAAAVVDDLDAAVGAQREHDAVAVAGERLVDGVVDDLGDQVVQAALTGRADVHARALADGLEALQHRDRRGVVVAVDVGGTTPGRQDRGRDVGSRSLSGTSSGVGSSLTRTSSSSTPGT